MKLRSFLFAVLLTLMPTGAWASAEGMLQWSDISYVSAGLGSSGPIRISGTQTSEGISSLHIEAFDRTQDLTSEQLAQLKGAFANGLQLSYEAGYKEVGGRTLYLMLIRGFTSGIQTTKLITFNEQGLLSIR